MEISKDKQPVEQNQTQPSNEHSLPADELKSLTDFFSILIQIDKRVTKTKNYGKQNK